MNGQLVVPTPAAFGELYSVPLGAVRERCYYGGRGSAKSWQIARALLVHGVNRRLRILCAREYQTSMKDSVLRILTDQIANLGLGNFYYSTGSSIIGENGTEFLFKGLRRDISQIKSTEGIDIAWLEEAESVSAASWRVLIPTIRKPGSEIWTTFNPALPTDATYQRLVVKSPPRSIVRRVSFRDNPWLPEVLNEEQATLFINDPEAWAHVWDGEPWSRSDAQVLNGKWITQDFTPDESFGEPLYGADWGFANDPTIIFRGYIKDKRLWVYKAQGKPQLSNDATAQLFRDNLDDERRQVRADSARPETINEMKLRGLNVVGVDKWPGSVADGISYLRSFDMIVIHVDEKRAIEEARLWRYKVDPRTQEVLPHLVAGFDHTWDAGRYALAPLIKARPRVGVLVGSHSAAVAASRKPAADLRPPPPPAPPSKPIARRMPAALLGMGNQSANAPEMKTAPEPGRRFRKP